VPPRRQAPAETHPEAPGTEGRVAPAPGGVVVAVPVAVDPAGVIPAVGVEAVRPVGFTRGPPGECAIRARGGEATRAFHGGPPRARRGPEARTPADCAVGARGGESPGALHGSPPRARRGRD